MLFRPSLALITSLVFVLTNACKSQQVEPLEYSMLIEMEKEVTLKEIKYLDGITIVDSKRSNRTLNQWVITISTTISQKEFVENLTKENHIVDVQPINQKPNTITTSTNEKKVKTKPTKND